MSSAADEARWGRTRIPYRYTYARRKTLAITVHPDLRVTVSAPFGTPLEKIRERVQKRAAWIRKAWREFDLYLPKQPPRRYISGETHRYLGRQYRLRVRINPDGRVKLLRGHLQVLVPAPQNTSTVKTLVEQWYRRQAERVFVERLEACAARAQSNGAGPPPLRIRRLAKRWGSCSTRGEVILNVELLKAPKECIDYVITHELAHLKEHHHGTQFWRLMDKLMPGWRERRSLLNRMADL